MLYSFRASFYLLFSFNIWQSLIDWNMQHWNLYVVNSSIPKSKLGSMTYLFVCVCEFCAIYYTYLYYSYSIDSICSHWFVSFFFLCDFPLILLLCIDLACSLSRARSFFILFRYSIVRTYIHSKLVFSSLCVSVDTPGFFFLKMTEFQLLDFFVFFSSFFN